MAILPRSIPHHKARVLLQQAANNMDKIRALGIFPGMNSDVCRSRNVIEAMLRVYDEDAAAGHHTGEPPELDFDDPVPPVAYPLVIRADGFDYRFADTERPIVAEAVCYE